MIERHRLVSVRSPPSAGCFSGRFRRVRDDALQEPDRRSTCSNRRAVLPSAATSGECSRDASRASRRWISSSKPSIVNAIPRSSNSLARRLTRSGAEAVRNTFRSASGNTTVPMSRPSATRPGNSRRLRCWGSKARRTAGRIAMLDAGRSGSLAAQVRRDVLVAEIHVHTVSGGLVADLHGGNHREDGILVSQIGHVHAGTAGRLPDTPLRCRADGSRGDRPASLPPFPCRRPTDRSMVTTGTWRAGSVWESE